MRISNSETKILEVFEDAQRNQLHEFACKVLAGTSEDKGMRLKAVIPKIRESAPDAPEYLVYRTLLDASRSELSPIQSGGPWKGYFLDYSKVVDEKSTDTQEIEPSIEIGKNKLTEKDLYPLIAHWMKVKKEYKRISHSVSKLRKGGFWSNPDVVALNPIDRLGFYDIEIVSAEIKLSDSGWRQYIFEAISHRRFADRSYYIFRSPTGMSTFAQEMFTYAEKFQVGIAIIELPDDKIPDLLRWKLLSETERLEFADSVIEVFPAPSDPVGVKEKCEFLGNINIYHKDELAAFGES